MRRLIAVMLIVAAVLTSVVSLLLLAAWPLGGFLDFGWPVESALWWDTGLSFLFFLQHSVMVRRRVKAALGIPVPYQSAVYATASGVTLTAVVVLWQRAGEPLLILEGAWRIAAIVLAIGAGAFFVWGIASLRGFDPFGVRTIRAHLKGRRMPNVPFMVRGPYRLVRHPLYSAVLVFFWCSPVITIDRLWFNVLWTAWIWVGLRLEEDDLIHEFGAPYKDYRRKVPALIPWRGMLKPSHHA